MKQKTANKESVDPMHRAGFVDAGISLVVAHVPLLYSGLKENSELIPVGGLAGQRLGKRELTGVGGSWRGLTKVNGGYRGLTAVNGGYR